MIGFIIATECNPKAHLINFFLMFLMIYFFFLDISPFCFAKPNGYDANICPTTWQEIQKWWWWVCPRLSWLALNNKRLCLSQCFLASQVMKHLLKLKLRIRDWCLQQPVRSFNIYAAPALPIKMVKTMDWLMIACINLPCSTNVLHVVMCFCSAERQVVDTALTHSFLWNFDQKATEKQ